MVGAAPTQAKRRNTAGPSARHISLFACAFAAIAITFGAAAASAYRVAVPESTHLWAIQLRSGNAHWLNAPAARVLRKDGINAVVLDVRRLGRAPRAVRTLDTTRRFAVREGLVLVAVVPRRHAHASPAVRHALRACQRHARGLRCATAAGSVSAAFALARRNRLAAVFVAGPSGFGRYAGLTTVPRHILVVAKLYGHFDPSVWRDVIARATSSTAVDLGVAPQTSLSSQPVKQFASALSSSRKTGITAPSNLATSNLAQRSVTLSWSEATANIAGYHLYRGGKQVGTSSRTTFAYNSLSCGTRYSLGVSAFDSSGRSSTISKTSVTTTACVDTTAPSLPTRLATSSVGQTAITLSWNASADDVGVAGYRLHVGGSMVGTTTGTSYTLSALSCNSVYSLGVAAYDAAGNTSAVATTAQQTQQCTGVASPPSTPTGLTSSNVGQTSITLSWNPSSSGVGLAGYQLSVNGSQVGTTASTSYTFTGLACGTTYTLGAAAVDVTSQVSGTATLMGQTQACAGDTAPPTTPSGLTPSNVGLSSITLSWAASSDNVGVAGYRLFLNGSQVGTSNSTSFSFGGLTCGISYTLGVAAYDAAGNVSGTATVGASTAACSGGGAVVYLSLSGSDASCVRGDSSRPCATPARAWSIAAAGDTIQVANGFYTSGCVLSGAKSAAVTFSGSASAKFACRMVFPDGAANAVVDGISLYQVESGEGTNTSNVTIKNGALTCTDSAPYARYAPDNFCSAELGIDHVSNWLIENESIGPSYDSESPCGSTSPNISRIANASNITFRNVVIHDVRYGCSAQHTENIRIDAVGSNTRNITFDGLTIYNGPNSGLHGQGGGPNSANLFMGGPGTLSGLVIQNSVMYGAGNVAIDGAADLGIQSSTIRDNSFALSMIFQYPGGYPSSFRIANNIAPDQGCAIGVGGSSGGSFGHNLWYYNGSGGSADRCDPSDLSVNGPGVVNTIFSNYAANDLTLASGSPAIDAGSRASGDFATGDKNGATRPCGPAPEIGAYERCP